jgi:branched-chain amino acid transport system substrate-binding protein
MARTRVTRRAFVRGAAAASAVGIAGVPALLRAQPRMIRIGMVEPVTGPMADVGQDSRLGATMAAEAINAAGGIKSMGGAKLELMHADSQTKPEVARAEAERLVNAGAQLLTGGYHSAHVATIAPLAQQRRIPYLIDITAADQITAGIAKSVREGQQKVQYVYRIFPGSAIFGRNAVRFMTEIFREANVNPKRAVILYSNDLFGKTQTESFLAAHKAAGPGFDVVDVIPYPENAADLSTEVSRAKAAKPDIIAPITRPVTAIMLLEELAKQRVDAMGIISPGAPGLYETKQIQQLKELIEYVMDATVYANYRKPETQRVAVEYVKRSGGRNFDASAAYSYDAILVIADALERAASVDPDAVVAAFKKTNFGSGLAVYSGPIVFNETGDNPNASTAMLQILGQKARVVWPKDVAEQKFVFPRPKA